MLALAILVQGAAALAIGARTEASRDIKVVENVIEFRTVPGKPPSTQALHAARAQGNNTVRLCEFEEAQNAQSLMHMDRFH